MFYKVISMAVKKVKDIPVTQKMLYGVINELKHDIASLEAKMEARFKRPGRSIFRARCAIWLSGL